MRMLSHESMNAGDGLMFYRCSTCHKVVSKWDIQEHHGCAHCGNNRIVAANLTLLEKIKQIGLHPRIWEWKNV